MEQLFKTLESNQGITWDRLDTNIERRGLWGERAFSSSWKVNTRQRGALPVPAQTLRIAPPLMALAHISTYGFFQCFKISTQNIDPKKNGHILKTTSSKTNLFLIIKAEIGEV